MSIANSLNLATPRCRCGEKWLCLRLLKKAFDGLLSPIGNTHTQQRRGFMGLPIAAFCGGRLFSQPATRWRRHWSTGMRILGQLGQRLGLVIPAIAIVLELNHAISLGQMLMLLVASVCLFGIGRILEGYSPS